jgi:hypothetical protein
MPKIVVFEVEKTDVKGDFYVHLTDAVVLIGKTTSAVHAWRDGADSCNLLGCPCPMQLMAGYTIPLNAYAVGEYSVGVSPPVTGEPGSSNGNLRVGSGPGDPEDPHPGIGVGRGHRHR